MRESPLRPSATVALISFCILHSAYAYYSTNPGYPAAYATLYSDQYGLAYQQIWNDPTVGVVQVHPPTFHGKYFQKNLFPLWARHVGLVTGETPVYTAPAALSLVPVAHVAPYTYPLATAPGTGTALAAYPPVNRPAAPAETGTQAPETATSPGEENTAATGTDAPEEDDGSQTEATPTDAQGMAAPLSATPAGDAESDDAELSVDPGASNNSPSFLGAPQTSTPVSVTVPEADGKRLVVYQFPNLLEGLVQRFQNYFSTYNHITTTSVANAVANANANAVSNAVSNSSSQSDSNSESNSKSDSKSASLSDSKSQSDSDSSSNSLSGSNADSGSKPGPGKGKPQQDEDVDGDPDGTGGVQSLEKQDQEETTTADSYTTAEVPTTVRSPATSTHRHPTYLPPPPFHGYPPQRGPPRQWAIEPPQKSLSYEVHITTEAPFNGYRYNRPRLPFDPYREHYLQRQRSNQWRPIPSRNWEGPRFHSGPQGRNYNYRPRFDSNYYPSRI